MRSERAPEPADDVVQLEPGAEAVLPAAPERPMTYRYTDVYAPVDGTVGEFAIDLGDEVAEGDALVGVQPQIHRAVGSISPIDRYRLLDRELSATVTIDGGPEPFRCGSPEIGDAAVETTPEPSAEEQMTGAEPAAETASRITCRIPDDVTVFDGLAMSLEVDAGSAEDVLVVPVTAVRGLVGGGTVWTVGETGEESERRIELGVTDGKVVEVVSGLEPGEQVLRFVPGSDPEPLGEPGPMGFYG